MKKECYRTCLCTTAIVTSFVAFCLSVALLVIQFNKEKACTDEGKILADNGTGCVCTDGLYLSENGKCVDPPTDPNCIGENEILSQDGTECVCEEGFTKVNDQCVEQPTALICNNRPNEILSEDGTECVCEEGFTNESGQCDEQPTVLNCTRPNEILSEGGTECVCVEGFTNESGQCFMDITLPTPITDCSIGESPSETDCECKPTNGLSDGKCVACRGENMELNNGECACTKGSGSVDSSGVLTCTTPTIAPECPENSTFNTSNVCRCNSGYALLVAEKSCVICKGDDASVGSETETQFNSSLNITGPECNKNEGPINNKQSYIVPIVITVVVVFLMVVIFVAVMLNKDRKANLIEAQKSDSDLVVVGVEGDKVVVQMENSSEGV